MILRPATAEDVPALHAVAQRAYSIYLERIGRRPAPMDDDYDARLRSAHVFVADDGGVVGLIVLIEAPDHLLIENVAVEPDRQHEGIGRALLSLAEGYAAEHGLDQLKLYTNVAMVENIRLYTRFGYQEDSRHIGAGFQRVYMSKRLR